MKIIFRILVFPFIFGIILISTVRLLLLKSYDFLVYGGEYVTYNKFLDQVVITDLIEEVKKLKQQ